MVNNNIGGGIVKRIILMVLCFMVISFSVCSAEIRKGQIDTFDNSFRINSLNHSIGDIEQFNFYKKKNELNVEYSFYIRKECLYEIQFGYIIDKFQIKINDDIYDLKVLKQNTQLNSYSFGHAFGEIIATIDVKNELLNEFKNAKNIAVRLTYSDGTNDTANIPDEVLAEWKQVIATEK